MPLRAWECFAAFSALRAQKKPLPAKGRGADDKGSECRRAQKSLPRIAGDIAFPRRNKGNRLKSGAGRTLSGNEPEGRVTKKGYNRICFRVHLYALICSCNLLKSKTGRRMTASFHAVDRGSNPLGDAKDFTALQKRFTIAVCCLQTHVYKMPRGVPACGAFPFPAAVRLRSLYCSRPERPS